MIAALGATIYHPFISSLVTTLGAVTGELVSYFIGYAGQNYIPESEWNIKIHEFMKMNGEMTIFLVSVIPNPFFDIAAIASGATDFPLWKFIVISFVGKFIKFSIFAILGKKIHSMLK